MKSSMHSTFILHVGMVPSLQVRFWEKLARNYLYTVLHAGRPFGAEGEIRTQGTRICVLELDWGIQEACWIVLRLLLVIPVRNSHCWPCKLVPCQHQWCSNMPSCMVRHVVWYVIGLLICAAYFTMCGSTRLLRAAVGSIQACNVLGGVW